MAWRAAIGEIRGYCGWHIAPSVTETVTLDGSASGVILLPTLRLTAAPTVVSVDGTTVEAENLQWSERGVVRFLRHATTKLRGVVMTITHGYTDFPPELLAVARDMALQDGRIGASGMTSGPHQIQFGVTGAGVQAGAVGTSDLQRRVIDRYRIKAQS